jgi:AcrR family transcriptional regulator
MASTAQAARSEAVRERILEGIRDLIEAGEELTFARVAKAAGVPERTLYRYFETREALFAAVFAWANKKIGFDGELPADRAAAQRLVRRVFPGFDEIASIVHELLVAPEGLAARQQNLEKRQRAATAIVKSELDLDRTTTRRTAAIVQLLTTAATWQTLRDFWGMDGKEAAETAALAIELVLDGARARAQR